ncbi:MAG: tetratricopeptide repeat protein [Kordiimonadaceae bacterium]|nr:tetratricopeptide repeat protein [Kordiimonadaceae bacterium]
MQNNLNKMLPAKKALTSFLLVAGLATLPTMSFAQSATEPWVGTIPGDNIYFSTTDEMSAIRNMLNNQDYVGAVNNAKKYISSLENFERSGKTSQFRYDAYNALCLGLTAQRKYDEAMEACNTAIEEAPTRWFAYNSRGSLNFRSGNFTEAEKDYRLALEHAPKSGNISEILEHNISLAQSKN